MSFISARGRAAAESATREDGPRNNAMKPFKSGTTYKVRVLSPEDIVEYQAASVFKVFHTTPVRPGNLYEKAADVLYKEAFAARDAGDDAKYEEIRNDAYQLKPKPRYLFAFADLEDGSIGLVDLSRAQAGAIIQSIERYEKRLDRLAFELSKQGQSTSTTVSLTPVIDMEEDLSEDERKNFEAVAGKEVEDDVFESALKEKTQPEQVSDLQAFGFDVSRIGVEAESAVTDEEEIGRASCRERVRVSVVGGGVREKEG